jgi:dipeptidyl-peptidase-4
MGSSTCCPERQMPREDYVRAERFLVGNVKKMAFRLEVVPQWIGESNRFWYKVDTREGKRFMFADPEKGIHGEAFDHVALAARLSKTLGKGFTHDNLPFDRVDFSDDGESIKFSVNGSVWKCQLSTLEIERSDSCPPGRPDEVESPNKEWVAFVKDHNLYIRNTGTGKEVELTTDGRPGFAYAEPFPSPIVSAGLLKGEMADRAVRPSITWSPDSRKILTFRIDASKAKECYLVQAVPSDGSKRPKMFPYVYGLPGDQECALGIPVIVDMETKTQVPVDTEPVQHLFYGAPRVWTYWTKGDKQRIIWLKVARGRRSSEMLEVDPESGATRVLFEENAPSGGDLLQVSVLGDGKEIVWLSQRDGWTHLYLYDGETGEVKNQITSGTFVVREIKWVDEAKRVIYFTACGKEQGRDPYYQHLYRVNLDGTDLRLLTPEDAEHQVSISPGGDYFVDTYSRVDLSPKTVLRSVDGDLVRVLEEADIEFLLATGWKYPERFKAKARDGITDIYGVIFKPSNFDPQKKYPVLEGNYSGPQTIRTPKAFPSGKSAVGFWQDQALAELGFIVVTVDGLGMNYRSRAFQDFAFKNLGDGGFPDHIAAFRQLADSRPYMDLSRVGIYGSSAGGYASARAILTHPDFYRVAVVWAGNHDHRIDKAGWVERYMGTEVGEHYEEQSNPAQAKNLVGRLLIMHGDMDENVPPAASMQLVDALIKANKEFDFLMLPNGVHGSGHTHPYIVRKRWDYFVRHLLGIEPPRGYAITESSLE